MKPPADKIRVSFLVRSLDVGGAEVQLSAIARGLDPERFEVSVIHFYAGGALEQELSDAGVNLYCLDKTGRWDLLPFFFRLLRIIRKLRPAVLHSFLGISNILAALMKLLTPRLRVIWGIRASNMDLTNYDITWRISFVLERLLSRYPDRIVSNSQAGADYILEQEFSGRRLEVVPNGIESKISSTDADARQRLRAEWGIPPEQKLIGMIARLDPMKDHMTFLRAAARLLAKRNDTQFVCVGGDGLTDRKRLRDFADELHIADKIVWAGYRADIGTVHSAIDLHTSCSAFGEGFSNSIAETMASGIPNVVTDVGDSAYIVGEFGAVVPPGSPTLLAQSWDELLSLTIEERQILVANCRQRIRDNFSHHRMTERMTAIYGEENTMRES